MKISNRYLALAAVAVGGILLAACGTTSSSSSASMPAPSQNIVQVASGNADFSTLVAAVKAAGLADTLSGPGPFTVFAPTNEAFAALPAGTLDTLLKPENKGTLAGILTYHVVSGSLYAKDVKAGSDTTVNGAKFTVSTDNGSVIITDGMGSRARIIKTDLAASNGVIHVIDAVLLPPAATQNIVQIAAASSDFSTLVAAVKAAGLVDTLSGPGPFTVFAPTNAAFAALPAGTLDTLLKPENKSTLAGILTYHVVSGSIFAKDVKAGAVTTVNGAKFTISVDNGSVVITDGKGNKAKVVKTDIAATNGVIHVIDAVLLPAS